MNGRWDIRILHASYKRESGESGVIVELCGRTRRENRSITVRCHGFQPYFHLIDPPARVLAELERDPKVHAVEPTTLFHDGADHDAARVVVSYPWEVPSFRHRYQRYCPVFAADILFTMRFIFDHDLGSCTTVLGEIVTDTAITDGYTSDLVVDATGFEPCEPFKPALKILSFDIENSLKLNRIYCICCAIRDPGAEQLRYAEFTGTDAEMIGQFTDLVRKEDPDIITGYNIEGYDLVELSRRAKELKLGALALSRDERTIKKMSERTWRIYGRIVADAWQAARRQLRPKKETLNHIAKLVLGEEKHDVDPSRIEEEWAADPDRVVKYCTKDAELALRILEAVNSIDQGMDLATVSKLPVDDIVNGRTSQMVDSILIRAADRSRVGVPCMTHGQKTEKIEGGYVHSLKPDLYHWVCVLDFRSMYPSIIIANNICFTTLSDTGEIAAPNGARFLAKEQRPGLLPAILKRLMADRDDAKQKMRAARAAGETEVEQYYDGLQAAIKILMNSFYGVFASAFYRFTNPDIGAAITAFARQNITRIIRLLESEGLDVIYSDTDSIFFSSPYPDLDRTIEYGTTISERFSKHGAVLEFEKILEPFFSHGKKKRYVGKVVWPTQETLIRGYETRRTDAFDLQSEALKTTFNLILTDRIDEVVPMARELISSIQDGAVPVEKLVISKTAKAPKKYKNPDQHANVQAMRKLKKLGYDFIYGMKVSYIVTNAKKTPQEVEPYIDGRTFEHEPDWRYYAERVAASLARVTEVFGWDERTLLTGIQQRSLFSDEFTNTGEDEAGTRGDKAGSGTTTDGLGADGTGDESVQLQRRRIEAERARRKRKKDVYTLDDFM